MFLTEKGMPEEIYNVVGEEKSVLDLANINRSSNSRGRSKG